MSFVIREMHRLDMERKKALPYKLRDYRQPDTYWNRIPEPVNDSREKGLDEERKALTDEAIKTIHEQAERALWRIGLKH